MALLQLDGPFLSELVSASVPGSVDGNVSSKSGWQALWVRSDAIADVAAFMQQDDELDFQFLNAISAIDFVGHFELVYHRTSFRKEHKATMRARLAGREDLSAPSVYHLWRGADFQEREIWDLMGIRFEGHPNMKRIMLWEGFDGHPLRKDYLG